MNDLELWAEILLRDVQNGLYFDALGDLEQVKACLVDELKSAIERYAQKAQ